MDGRPVNDSENSWSPSPSRTRIRQVPPAVRHACERRAARERAIGAVDRPGAAPADHDERRVRGRPEPVEHEDANQPGRLHRAHRRALEVGLEDGLRVLAGLRAAARAVLAHPDPVPVALAPEPDGVAERGHGRRPVGGRPRCGCRGGGRRGRGGRRWAWRSGSARPSASAADGGGRRRGRVDLRRRARVGARPGRGRAGRRAERRSRPRPRARAWGSGAPRSTGTATGIRLDGGRRRHGPGVGVGSTASAGATAPATSDTASTAAVSQRVRRSRRSRPGAGRGPRSAAMAMLPSVEVAVPGGPWVDGTSSGPGRAVQHATRRRYREPHGADLPRSRRVGDGGVDEAVGRRAARARPRGARPRPPEAQGGGRGRRVRGPGPGRARHRGRRALVRRPGGVAVGGGRRARGGRAGTPVRRARVPVVSAPSARPARERPGPDRPLAADRRSRPCCSPARPTRSPGSTSSRRPCRRSPHGRLELWPKLGHGLLPVREEALERIAAFLAEVEHGRSLRRRLPRAGLPRRHSLVYPRPLAAGRQAPSVRPGGRRCPSSPAPARPAPSSPPVSPWSSRSPRRCPRRPRPATRSGRRTARRGLRTFMEALATVESGGRYTARNPTSGAYGRYQIMPSNWPSLGPDLPRRPACQADAGEPGQGRGRPPVEPAQRVRRVGPRRLLVADRQEGSALDLVATTRPGTWRRS